MASCSVLVAGVLILTGLVLNKDIIELIRTDLRIGWIIASGLALISFVILGIWRLWLRNTTLRENACFEVMDRIEFQMGMYSILLIAEAYFSNKKGDTEQLDRLLKAKKLVYETGEESFKQIHDYGKAPRIRMRHLATLLVILIPLIQLAILIATMYLKNKN